jgi:hypothetical protein
MRKCKFNVPDRIKKAEGYGYTYQDHWREGSFHQWGLDYEEFESGPGIFSVAIVECEDGKVYMPYAGNIEFFK